MTDGALNEGLLDGSVGLLSFLAASGDSVGDGPFAEGGSRRGRRKVRSNGGREGVGSHVGTGLRLAGENRIEWKR